MATRSNEGTTTKRGKGERTEKEILASINKYQKLIEEENAKMDAEQKAKGMKLCYTFNIHMHSGDDTSTVLYAPARFTEEQMPKLLEVLKTKHKAFKVIYESVREI